MPKVHEGAAEKTIPALGESGTLILHCNKIIYGFSSEVLGGALEKCTENPKFSVPWVVPAGHLSAGNISQIFPSSEPFPAPGLCKQQSPHSSGHFLIFLLLL